MFELKRAKRRNAFQTGTKIYLSKIIFWGYGHFKRENKRKTGIKEILTDKIKPKYYT